MADYISEPVRQDRAAIKQEMADALAAGIPELVLPAGSPLDALLDVIASDSAALREQINEVLAIIFAAWGKTMLRVPQRDATYATGTSTWTRIATDTAPRVLDAGTEFTLAGATSQRFAFRTLSGVTFAAGQASVDVDFIALVAGADSSGLSADPQPEQTFAWLDHIAISASSTGGEDGEGASAYLDRLADESQTLTKTLLLPEHYEIDARNRPGIARALALDNYKPGPPYDTSAASSNQPGTFTIALASGTGLPVGTVLRQQTQADQQAQSAHGLKVYAIDPTYTLVTVVFTARAERDYDPVDVETRAEQAVLDFLSPAVWGRPRSTKEPADVWIDTPILRYQDLVTVLNGVEGFDYYTTLTVNGGTSDVTLAGPAALPDPATTVAGTVTA